ncbi:hypothetical protein KPH14_012640 [Odynerus spinipes]|uniref:Uncharacterized protein n=1 Tax=Odynerus spinipes TaxID=1348599 RepID=A0AAD9VLF3_9HYME|nr:hypothetical protein KPH14_012640 [Odynerus spinipes]
MSNHPSNYPLNFLQLSNLLERTYGSHNPLTVAKEFTNDIPTLIDMLNKPYSLTADKGQKNRFTRLIKKLSNEPSVDPPQQSSILQSCNENLSGYESSNSSTMELADP